MINADRCIKGCCQIQAMRHEIGRIASDLKEADRTIDAMLSAHSVAIDRLSAEVKLLRENIEIRKEKDVAQVDWVLLECCQRLDANEAALSAFDSTRDEGEE
jgi:hypothetical protein